MPLASLLFLAVLRESCRCCRAGVLWACGGNGAVWRSFWVCLTHNHAILARNAAKTCFCPSPVGFCTSQEKAVCFFLSRGSILFGTGGSKRNFLAMRKDNKKKLEICLHLRKEPITFVRLAAAHFLSVRKNLKKSNCGSREDWNLIEVKACAGICGSLILLD